MNLMVKMRKLQWAVVLLVTGCASGELEGWTELPSYPEATNAKTYNLKEEKARQLSYEVDAEYPDLGVVEFYSEHIGAPWVPCFSGAEWKRLVNDDDELKVLTVHEVRLHWVNFEQDRLLLLGVWYQSKGKQAVDIPDNSGQKVDLVEYQDANVTELIERLELACDGGR
jgi:hypothetical protein